MARAPRSSSELIDESRRLLKESTSGYFDDELLLDLLNQCKDEREMQLHDTLEGYGVVRVTTDLVANQANYTVPRDLGRLSRVLRILTDSENAEVPLVRDDLIGQEVTQSINVLGLQYLPTWRPLGQYIRLDPAPQTGEEDGLAMEFEQVSERMGPGSFLPVDWPLFAETLLVLDVAVEAYEVERGVGDAVDDKFDMNPHRARRNRFAARWEAYCESRGNKARSYAQPFRQGA